MRADWRFQVAIGQACRVTPAMKLAHFLDPEAEARI